MASLGADAAHRNQPLEEPLLFAIEKTEERNLILADLGVNVQRCLGSQNRQGGKRRHGDGDVVSHAAGLDDGLARLLVDELPAKMSDHLCLIVVGGEREPASRIALGCVVPP